MTTQCNRSSLSRAVRYAWMGGMLIAVVATGCAGAARQNRPIVQRSPSLDYQQSTTTTASGRSLGADRVSPSDKLEQGPRVGSDNALAPGWTAGAHGLNYDEKRRVGGATSAQAEQEHDR
ncbi:MAG TPA: hypothetical protein VKP30_10125 [Polyangiaceae bacterium]|nr:hypothetical protein [Polyangiaceae bacterium]